MKLKYVVNILFLFSLLGYYNFYQDSTLIGNFLLLIYFFVFALLNYFIYITAKEQVYEFLTKLLLIICGFTLTIYFSNGIINAILPSIIIIVGFLYNLIRKKESINKQSIKESLIYSFDLSSILLIIMIFFHLFNTVPNLHLDFSYLLNSIFIYYIIFFRFIKNPFVSMKVT